MTTAHAPELVRREQASGPPAPAPGAAPAGAAAAAADPTPVAVVADVLTPYRLHFHRRIARELPQVKLFSLFTHGKASAAWAQQMPPEINPVEFGRGEEFKALRDGKVNWLWWLQGAAAEWRRGGRMIRWLAENNVRAVVVNGYNDMGRVRVMRWCRRRGIPLLLWADSNVRGDEVKVRSRVKARLKRASLRRLVSRVSAVLPCGSLGRRFFEKYGADPGRMFYVPYEPDYDLIRQVTAGQVDEVRARFNLSPARRRIVYSGRLIPLKRVDLVIDAFAAIAGERPDWDLVIVGDGPLKQELHDRVPQELRGRVLYPGFMDQKSLSAVYRACDVLVLASEHDAWALVINEAAAAGLAIVSSDVVGASAELVRDGVNGRLFPRGDLAGITQCLRDVTDPAKIDAMKAASPGVLEDWRRRADPVDGLRGALQFCGVIRGGP